MNFENPTYDATGNIVCMLNGYPFQITQNETPVEWADIQTLIAAGLAVAPYVAPSAPVTTPEQGWTLLKAQAMGALNDSDITVLRCFEHGVALPGEWAAYRASLRAIVRAPSGDPSQGLPVKPAYPAGT